MFRQLIATPGRHACTHAPMHTHHTHAGTTQCLYARTYTCTHTCIPNATYLPVYICMFVYVFICEHILIYDSNLVPQDAFEHSPFLCWNWLFRMRNGLLTYSFNPLNNWGWTRAREPVGENISRLSRSWLACFKMVTGLAGSQLHRLWHRIDLNRQQVGFHPQGTVSYTWKAFQPFESGLYQGSGDSKSSISWWDQHLFVTYDLV